MGWMVVMPSYNEALAKIKALNPYSADDISQIKKALANRSDGRFEKKRMGKKLGRGDSTANITMQDIFPEKNNNQPVIKQGNQYYVVFDKLGEGEFGKVKFALNVDTEKLFVIKTQETFVLGRKLGKFEPASIGKNEEDDSELKKDIYDKVIRLNNEQDEDQKYQIVYSIYENIFEYIKKFGEDRLDKDDVLVYIASAFDTKKKQNIDDFKKTYNDDKEDIYTRIKFAQNGIENGLEHSSHPLSENEKHQKFIDETRRRVALEFEALKSLGRAEGEIIERFVEREIPIGHQDQVTFNEAQKGNDIQFSFLAKYHPGRTLYDYIEEQQKKQNEHDFSVDIKLSIAIVTDWVSLRDKGFYHCDLKPENVIVDEESQEAKLLDLGSVSKFNSETATANQITPGAPMYADQERGQAGYQTAATEASEVYYMGLMLAEIHGFADSENFPTPYNNPDYPKYKLDPALEPSPDFEPDRYGTFWQINVMLQDDRALRPTMNSVLQSIKMLEKRKLEQGVFHDEVIEKLFSIDEKLLILNRSKNMLNKFIEVYKAPTFYHQAKLTKDMLDYFNAQCEKYSKNEEYNKSKRFSLFSRANAKKSRNPIEILNKESNDHYLTREIGLILKEIKKLDNFKGMFSHEVKENLDQLMQHDAPKKRVSSRLSKLLNR